MRSKILMITIVLFVPLMFVNFISIKDDTIAVTSTNNQSVQLSSQLKINDMDKVIQKHKYVNVLDALDEDVTPMLDSKGVIIVIAYAAIALITVSMVILYTIKTKKINQSKIMIIGGMLMALSPLVLNAVSSAQDNKQTNNGVIAKTFKELDNNIISKDIPNINLVKNNSIEPFDLKWNAQ